MFHHVICIIDAKMDDTVVDWTPYVVVVRNFVSCSHSNVNWWFPTTSKVTPITYDPKLRDLRVVRCSHLDVPYIYAGLGLMAPSPSMWSHSFWGHTSDPLYLVVYS